MSGEMELNEDFPVKVRKSLSEGNTLLALSLFTDNKNETDVQNNSWDLIPIVTEYMNKNVEKQKPEVFGCCQEIMNIISNKSNAEEALFQLIEAVESAKDDLMLISLLKPLQKILFRLPKKRLHSLAWCFNSIQTYLNTVELPENYNLTEKERILMDTDLNVERITILYIDLLPFYDTFINELRDFKDPKIIERRKVLSKFLIQLLGQPLAYLDVHYTEEIKCSRARRIGENIVNKISQVTFDPYILLELIQERHDSELFKPNNLSVGVFFYLVLVEQVCINSFPLVYDSVYLFQNSLCLVIELLKYENQFIVEKGLMLIEHLLKKLEGIELSYELLDIEEHSKFCKALSNVIIFNQLESYRKTALKIFNTYLHQFETRGRYLLIYNLMKILNHTNLIGYIITQYKDMIAEEFKNNENNMSKYFIGEKLYALLRMFCHLHKSEESDLIELADQIVASLNLLRYLVIRDKNNVTKIQDYFKILEKNYFEPLKKGLMLSREHYELKLKDLNTESAKGDKIENKSEVNITVAGKELPGLSTKEKLHVLNSSLISFDIMESLLSRLKECIAIGVSSK